MQKNQKSFDINLIINDARIWALGHGIMKRVGKNGLNDFNVAHLPFTLLPTPFPIASYEKALALQSTINKLYYKIATNSIFLHFIYDKIADKDPFIDKLWKIFLTVTEEGFAQDLQLGLIRTDYLLHDDTTPFDVEDKVRDRTLGDILNAYNHVMGTPTKKKPKLKQVEVNCIAASFAGISSRITEMHRHTLQRLGFEGEFLTNQMPENKAFTILAEGLIQAWQSVNNPWALILFVVEDVITINEFDQRFLEWEITRLEPKVSFLRLSFSELKKYGNLDEKTRVFTVRDQPLGVVYYRTGYNPNDYKNEEDWHTRYLLEKSTAIKCPSIQFQLAGTKKVQEVINDPQILGQFFAGTGEKVEMESLMESFVKFYPIDKVLTTLFSPAPF
ncbi:unnamed protein product [Gordionus sp. m RMFG-2023]